MNITKIISVSPVNPAHGLHEVHARTREGIDIPFQVSPEALGTLTGYFGYYTQTDKAYADYQKLQKKALAAAPKKQGK